MPASGPEIKGTMTLDTSDFDSALSRAQQRAESSTDAISRGTRGIGTSFEEAGKKSTDATGAMNVNWHTVGETFSDLGGKLSLFVTLPLLGVGAAGFKVAGQFDQSMAEGRAITGATGDDFNALREEALDLGASTAYSADEVATAMVNMGKAGWDTNQILDGMSGVLDAAAASGEDLGTVSTIVADAISGFGLQAADATHVADLLAQAANAGTIDITDLGESFKYVAPVAASMGFSIEDCSTALLAMSTAGIKGSQAGTSLRTMMTNLASPTAEAAGWMERLGIEVVNTDGTFKSLDEIIDIMQVSFAGLTDEEKAQAAEAIAGKEGLSGLLSVVGMAPEKYDELTASMRNADGVAHETAETMQDNVMSKLEQLGGALETLAIKLGDILIPKISSFIEWLTGVVDKFAELPSGVQGFILALLGIVAAIGPVMKGVGSLILTFEKIPATVSTLSSAFSAVSAKATTVFASLGEGGGIISSLTAAFPGLGSAGSAALGVLSGPVGIVIAAIAALVAVFVTLWNTNEDFRNSVTAIWEGIVSSFQNFTQGIVDRLNALGFNFKDITEVLWAVWSGFCNLLAPVFEGAFQVIATVLDTIFGVITGILDIFIGIFTGNWDQAWQGVQEVFGSIWDGIVSIFTTVFETFSNVSNAFFGFFGTSWQEIWTNVGNFLMEVWNGIVTFLTETWTNITTTLTEAWNAIPEFFANLWTMITEGLTNFGQTIIDFFTQLPYNVGMFLGYVLTNVALFVVNMVNKAIELGTNFLLNIVTFFSQLPGNIANFINSAFNFVVNWVINMINKAIEMGQRFLSSVVQFFSQLPGNIANFINSAWNSVVSWASNMVNKALEMGQNFINNVRSTISNLPSMVAGFLSEAISSVISWVSEMGAKGMEAAQSLIDGVVNGAAGLASSVAEIGSNIVQGVWNGIQNAVGWFTSSVNSFFSGIVDGAKAALGISSPSRVFANEVGRWIPAGVAMGVQSAASSAHEKIQGSFDDMLTIDTKSVDFSTDGIDLFCDTVTNKFYEMQQNISSMLSSMAVEASSLMPQVASMYAADSFGQVSLYGSGVITNAVANRTATQPSMGSDESAATRGGDTFIFNSPRPIDEIEAARQISKTKRSIAEGF